VRPEPQAQAAAGLRASRADRERVIDLLKAAFVQGRLDRDEFDARIGQALASRTYGELAAVTADIPAELIGTLPRRPPVRARRRISFNTAVTGGRVYGRASEHGHDGRLSQPEPGGRGPVRRVHDHRDNPGHQGHDRGILRPVAATPDLARTRLKAVYPWYDRGGS
jgi:hypothetical protein